MTCDPLIIVCDWIPPAFGAVGQYEMLRAREAATRGRTVHLIGLGAAEGREVERIGEGSLTTIRIVAKAPNKSLLLERAMWSGKIGLKLLAALSRSAKSFPRCEIKMTGSPPFFSYTVLLWRLFNRRHSITYRITDFYPETALAARRALFLRLLLPIVHALRNSADRIEALSDCQKMRLVENGMPASRIELCRDASPVSFVPRPRPAGRPFAGDVQILLYSGNLGFAHDWSAFAEAYRRHVQEGPNRVRLWLNATGVGVARLRDFCTAHDLPVHVSEPVALNELGGVLLAADAHLILLGDRFWGYVFPSKTYACLDSGRPCIYVGPAESDVNALLSNDARHASVRHQDIQGLVKALDRLCVAPRVALATADREST